ncbi:MAG: proline--tRNA ligase [Euryarchaeota archaeon]
MTDFSEWFHDILEEAEIIDSRYPVKGMHVWLPHGFQLRKEILNILKNILDRDHDEVLFPLLIPEGELAKEGIHVKGFEDEVYWITHGGLTELNQKLALRPTSETAMYPMFALWVRSHTDLPLKVYQTVNTFRYETKHTRPLIRVREITTFTEAHTVHSTRKEAEEQVEKAIEIYKEYFDMLALPYVITRRPVWDKFPGADYTMAFDTIMPDGKSLQIGTVHNLGQTFAKTFEITFENTEGDHKLGYQTCYGLSDRVIASVIGIHGDDSGLCLPPAVSPKQTVIVPIIFKKKGEEVLEKCRSLKSSLEKEGFRVHLDDRDIRAGKKYYEWEMRGVPLRIEIGPRDLEKNSAVLSRRDNGEKFSANLDNICDEVENTLKSITSHMKEKAWAKMNSNIRPVEGLEEARNEIENNKGVISFDWCGNEECGKEIEEKIRVDILGVQKEEENGGVCFHCSSKATCRALLARTY